MVAVWLCAMVSLEAMRALSLSDIIAVLAVAAYTLATSRLIPWNRIPLTPVRHVLILFVSPIVLSIGAVIGAAMAGKTAAWAIVAASFIAVARLNDGLNTAAQDPPDVG